MNSTRGVGVILLTREAKGESLCQSRAKPSEGGEGVTTIGSSPSTAAIGTPLEVRTN